MKAASLLNLFFICLCFSIPLTGQQVNIVDPPRGDVVVENGKPVQVGCKVENCDNSCSAQLHKDQLMIWHKETGFYSPLKDELMFVGNENDGDFTIRIPKPSIKTDGFYKWKFIQRKNNKFQRPIETVAAYINVTIKPEKPVITSAEHDKLFLIKKRKEGVEKVEIFCTANLGKPPPVIRLQVGDNQPLLPTRSFSVASGISEEISKLHNVTAKFEIDLDRSLDNVRVTCTATNYATKQLGISLESSAVIKILSPPTIHIRQTPEGHVTENDTVTIECWSTSEPKVSVWRWKENSSSINIRTSTYKFIARRRYHTTKFSCFGDNRVDNASKSVVLMVQYPPRFLNDAKPVQINLTMSESVELNCKVDAYPTAIVYWTKDGRNVHAGESYRFTVDSPSKLGKYVCTAVSVRFPNVSRDMHVFQKHKPNIISKLTQTGEYKAKGSLTCTALAQPDPYRFIMLKNGKTVPVSSLDRLVSKVEKILGGAKYTLTFTELQSSDFGEYNCTVYNQLGSDWKLINFEETKSPDLKYILIGSMAGLLVVILLIVIIVSCKLRQHSSSGKVDKQAPVTISNCLLLTVTDSNASTTPMHVEPIKNVVDVDKKDTFPDDNICDLSNYSEHWDYSTYPGDFIYDQHYPDAIKQSYLPAARPDSRLSTNV
ncbi:DgyrCDS5094 [Dimorphilus gyrociliatus]|uniref:DgyrCDS5094 n=1 Tax=Dimorphilus gyrociliatus TaxID=2664684 RepID=A0A7I8VLH1_9ANNE|nr:DgyrCDS5094 [Dimorphilus gyrociliatus]